MIRYALYVAATAGTLAVAAACSRSSAPATDAPEIRLVTPAGAPAYVEITGLSASTLDRLDTALTPEQWQSVVHVAVGDDAPAILGAYSRKQDAVRFVPAFPFDGGRVYQVRVDLSRVPGHGASAVVSADVMKPAPAVTPTTVVRQVYPSGDEVPENLLRMYVEFSAPMARRGGFQGLHLLDERDREVVGAFLPLDYELWSPDARRLTLFFDPGRVKDGILPNQQLGRPLVAGRTYTLVFTRDWRDEQGVPLAQEYRHAFHVGRAQTSALAPAKWRLSPPQAGSRGPLTVEFPEPLDHGLLMRALGVRSGNEPVDGDIRVESGETRWVFTPAQPWRTGVYELLALSILEDPSGNRIGRAFEIENHGGADEGPDARTMSLSFTVRGNTTD